MRNFLERFYLELTFLFDEDFARMVIWSMAVLTILFACKGVFG